MVKRPISVKKKKQNWAACVNIAIADVLFPGSTLIKVCVMKDKHHLYSHITQPNRHQEESPKDAVPMETQSPTNKSVWLGSFSAVLDSGIHLSYSHYDPTGEQGEHLTLMLSVSLSLNHLVYCSCYGDVVWSLCCVW